MKKSIFSLLLAAFVAVASTQVAMAEPAVPSVSEPNFNMLGAWEATKNPTIPKAVRKAFNKATEGLVGGVYKPVAYLGHQVVAGTNHCLLCSAQGVYPGSEPYYALVYIYEDLDGNAEITAITDLDIAGLSNSEG